VSARWRLTLTAGEPHTGRALLVLLVLHRRKGDWQIVEDASF